MTVEAKEKCLIVQMLTFSCNF